MQADSQVHRLLGWGQKVEAEVCVCFNTATSNFKANSDSVCVCGGEFAGQVLRLTTSLPDFLIFP